MKIKRSFITKGGINPQSEETPRPQGNPPSACKPPPGPPPKPMPSPVVDQFGKPIGKPMPEWKISLICWGLAVLTVSFFIMVGLIIRLETSS